MLNPWIRFGWPAKSSETRAMTPGVSILFPCQVSIEQVDWAWKSASSRLAFEVLHDIEEPIIHIRLVGKLDLDLVEVTEGILLNAGISMCTTRQSLENFIWALSATEAAVESHIKYGLLSLVHGSGRWAHGTAGGHAAAKRHRLSSATTSFSLQRRAEDGSCAPGRAHGTIRRHGGMWARSEHWVLRWASAILCPMWWRLSVWFAVEGTNWAGTSRTGRTSGTGRCAQLDIRRRRSMTRQETTGAVYCSSVAICYGLVDGQRPGIAVMGCIGRVWLSVWGSVATIPISVSVTFHLDDVVVRAMSLVVHVGLQEPRKKLPA